MKKYATVLKNGFLKSYGALRTFMQNNPMLLNEFEQWFVKFVKRLRYGS